MSKKYGQQAREDDRLAALALWNLDERSLHAYRLARWLRRPRKVHSPC